MKKTIVFTLLLSVLSVALIGCQSKDHDNASDTTVKEVGLSAFESGVAKLDSNFFGLYEDKKTKNMVNDAISNATKIDGIFDVAKPEFYVDVVYADGHTTGYYLWLGKKGQTSTIVDVKDTHVAYSVSKEATKQIIDLIEEDLVH